MVNIMEIGEVEGALARVQIKIQSTRDVTAMVVALWSSSAQRSVPDVRCEAALTYEEEHAARAWIERKWPGLGPVAVFAVDRTV